MIKMEKRDIDRHHKEMKDLIGCINSDAIGLQDAFSILYKDNHEPLLQAVVIRATRRLGEILMANKNVQEDISLIEKIQKYQKKGLIKSFEYRSCL